MRIKHRISLLIWNKWRDFQCTEIYWKFRHSLRLLVFYNRRFIYQTYHFVENRRNSTGVLNTIARSGLKSLFFSTILFFLSTTLDTIIFRYFPQTYSFGQNLTDLTLGLFNSKVTLNHENYTSFMGGLSSVAGVFLGLYFTVMSVGIGPHMDKLSPNLRKLIVTEKTGSRYVELLTIFTALTFMLWFNAGALDNFSLLSIFIVLLYSLLLICAFYPLGQQSFFLADPPSLAMPLFEKINGIFRKLSRIDSIYHDDAFHNHFRTQIAYQIDSVEEVLDLALEKDAKGKIYVSNIIQNLFNQTIYYLTFKQLIPKNSFWFQKIVKHDDWLYQDDTKTNILKTIGTIPEPMSIPDHYWLEKKVVSLVIRSVIHYRDQGDAEGLIEVLSKVRISIFRPLAYGWYMDLIVKIYGQIQRELGSFLFRKEIDFQKKLQITELLAIIGIDIVQQSLQRVIDDNFPARIEKLARMVIKGHPLRKVDTWETPAVKSAFENLSNKLKAETRIEGKQISPEWYICQVLANASANEAKEILEQESSLFFDQGKFDPKQLTFEDAAIRALTLQSQIELATRLKNHKIYFRAYIEKLKKYQKIEDLKLNDIPEDFNVDFLEKNLDHYYDQMADLILHLFKSKRDEELPDFFGIAYVQLIDEVYRLLDENKEDRFLSLFSKLLWAAVFARQRLSNEYSNAQDTMARFKVSFDPFLDLMSLSGYAKAFSELHSNPKLFEIAAGAWTKVLSELNLNMDTKKWLIQCYRLVKSDFRMSRGFSKRFYWERLFLDLLTERGFISDRMSYRDEPENVPTTPFMKALCAGGYEPHEDMAEVFLVAYILTQDDPGDLIAELDSTFLRRVIENEEEVE